VDDVLVINRGRLLAHEPLETLLTRGANLEDVFLELTAKDAS
jgi:hypothetical protein